MTRVGVLALQGSFAEHIQAFVDLDVFAVAVRLPKDLARVDGLVIPGGESTTVSHLMNEFGLVQPVGEMAGRGFPLWGTCAGMIILARQSTDLDRPTLAVMDISVKRNGVGRQVDSFEAEVDVPVLGPPAFPAVFIRAPVLLGMGSRVRALASLATGTVVAVQEDNLLATAFHPELTRDLRFHRYFLEMVSGAKAGRTAGTVIATS
jgi:5'-phosphate synthase pdxT subunit